MRTHANFAVTGMGLNASQQITWVADSSEYVNFMWMA
jgi:hypothetical protein